MARLSLYKNGWWMVIVCVFLLAGCGSLGEYGAQLAEDRDRTRVPQQLETDLASTLREMGNFNTALTLLESAEILPALPNPSTLLLPTDEAFASLPTGALDALRNNRDVLQNLLTYHVVAGRESASNIRAQTAVNTLSTLPLPIVSNSSGVAIAEGNLIAVDVAFDNGVIHALDRVLLPLPDGMRPPLINGDGVATFTGSYLTVVGSAEPNKRIILHSNGIRFGSAIVDENGEWLIANNIAPGTYQLIAYMTESNLLPLASSPSIELIVNE